MCRFLFRDQSAIRNNGNLFEIQICYSQAKLMCARLLRIFSPRISTLLVRVHMNHGVETSKQIQFAI